VTYLFLDILWSITGNAKTNISISHVTFFTIQKQLYFSESCDCFSLVRIYIYIFLHFYSQHFSRLIYIRSCRVIWHTLKKFRESFGAGFWNILRIYTSNLCASFVVHYKHLPLKDLFRALNSRNTLRLHLTFCAARFRSQLFEMTAAALHFTIRYRFSLSLFFSLRLLMPTVSIIDQFPFGADYRESGTPVTDGKHSRNSRLASIAR